MNDDQRPAGFPWRVTAVVAVVVIVASALIGVLLGRDRVDSAAGPAATSTSSTQATPTAVPAVGEREITVLLTVRDDFGRAVGAVLYGLGDGAAPVRELLLPRAVLVPTTPPMRLGQVTRVGGLTQTAEAVQSLLGVQVDVAVQLDRLAWRGLLDSAGGQVDPGLGEQPGSFALAVDPVLALLPADAARTSQVLLGLGSMARTSVTNEDAGQVLTSLGAALRAGDPVRSVLPVTYLRAGDVRAGVVRRAEADVLVARLFPDALLRTGHPGPLRVVVQRAGASVGDELAARVALSDAGIAVVADRSAEQDVSATEVLVPDATAAAIAGGEQVAAALGLPPSVVGVDATPSAPVDARVLLGAGSGAGAGTRPVSPPTNPGAG